jgi:hypothetical protein
MPRFTANFAPTAVAIRQVLFLQHGFIFMPKKAVAISQVRIDRLSKLAFHEA